MLNYVALSLATDAENQVISPDSAQKKSVTKIAIKIRSTSIERGKTPEERAEADREREGSHQVVRVVQAVRVHQEVRACLMQVEAGEEGQKVQVVRLGVNDSVGFWCEF